eukprot:11292826-Alexandrium_andersonii.AAC.1
MSASLVGSEMCIRDRQSGVPRAEQSLFGAFHTAAVVCKTAAWGRERNAAVSYTHLTLPTICSV